MKVFNPKIVLIGGSCQITGISVYSDHLKTDHETSLRNIVKKKKICILSHPPPSAPPITLPKTHHISQVIGCPRWDRVIKN